MFYCNKKKSLPLVILCFLLLFVDVTVAQTKSIIVSIKPLHSLVAGVLGDTANAELLVTGNASPHDFRLKPSQIKSMQEAQIIFYIDDSLETALTHAFEALPNNVRKVPVAKKSGLTLLPSRKGGVWEADEHHDAHHHHEEHHHDADGYDIHVWLDPKNAEKMILLIAEELSAAYPDNADTYKANVRMLTEKLNSLDTKLKAEFLAIRNKPFIVFHDAYQYLEHAYGLNCAGSITFNPDESPSPVRIKAIREKIRQTEAVCIFKEPQFSDRLIQTVSEGFNIKVGTLDPLGTELPADQNLYFKLLEDMAENLKRCLQ